MKDVLFSNRTVGKYQTSFDIEMFAGPSLCRFIFDWLVELTGMCRLKQGCL
jgi:hypothetical protein